MRSPTPLYSLHYALAFLFFIQSTQCKTTPTVTWKSPSDGDIFGPGDTIVGQWEASTAVVSPSFRLCSATDGLEPDLNTSSEDSCGSAVWPTVTQTAGSYSISIAAPGTTSDEAFYLEMQDDFGEKTWSPCFSIHPAAVSSTNGDDSGTSDPTDESPPPPSPLHTSPLNEVSPPVMNPSPSPPPTFQPAPASTSSYIRSPSAVPYFAAVTRTPPSVAAFAVPLSLVGAIILVASGFSVRHHRKLKDERACDAAKIQISRGSSFLSHKSRSTFHGDIEATLGAVRNKEGVIVGHGAVPILVFTPVDVGREPRRQTRQPFCPPSLHPSTNPSGQVTYIHRYQPSTRSLTPLLPHSQHIRHTNEQATDATITASLISNYLQPSPALPQAPQRLHTRIEVPLSLSPQWSYSYRDKPLPSSPSPR